jgi:hypothetical protein
MREEQAVALYDSSWWVGKSFRDIAGFQLFEERLCCPFDVFQDAVEKSLGRPVFTHEFGLNVDGLKKEFLRIGDPPTLKEIIEMIPEEKRVVVYL